LNIFSCPLSLLEWWHPYSLKDFYIVLFNSYFISYNISSPFYNLNILLHFLLVF
jgi:hypothetical protein